MLSAVSATRFDRKIETKFFLVSSKKIVFENNFEKINLIVDGLKAVQHKFEFRL